MVAKSKTNKRKRPVQNIVRFQVYDRDVQMIGYLSRKKNLTMSNVIRLALAECAERYGYEPGRDYKGQTSEHAAGVLA